MKTEEEIYNIFHIGLSGIEFPAVCRNSFDRINVNGVFYIAMIMKYIQPLLTITVASVCFFLVLPILTIFADASFALYDISKPFGLLPFLVSGFVRYSMIGILIAFILSKFCKKNLVIMTFFTALNFIFLYGFYLSCKAIAKPFVPDLGILDAAVIFIVSAASLLVSSILMVIYCKDRDRN